MKLSTKVAYNTAIQIASKIISTILGLIAIAIITRYLGQTGFGKYTTVITFLSLFAILADLGLTLVTVQLISTVKNKIEESVILGNLLGLRLVSALLFLGLGPLAIFFFPYEHDIKIGVLITSLSFLFIALNQVFVGLFQKYLRMDKVSIAEIVNRVCLLFGIILAVKYNFGLNGILLATSISSAISFIIHYLFSRQFAGIKLHFDFSYWRMIIARSWPLAITIFFNLIYLRTDMLLLSLIKRPSQLGIIAEVGIYGAAYKVIDVLITLPFMFAGIILPILTLRWVQKDYDGFKNILQKSVDFMMIIAIPLVVGTQFIAKEIIFLVAGREFSYSAPILQILIFASGLIFIGCMFAHAIIAIDKQKKIIKAYIFTAVTSVIGYLLFIPIYSYYGAAWVSIYSEAFIAFASIYITWKHAGFKLHLNIFFKSLLASAIMAICLYFIKNYISDNLLILLLSAILTYCPSLFIMKGISKDDLLMMVNK
jgi:O-antigen/teichoic acid export membrane protein